MREAATNAPLVPGDIFVTKHSNLDGIHLVFHLVCSSQTLAEVAALGRSPLVAGLRAILLTASQYDVVEITLPYILVDNSPPAALLGDQTYLKVRGSGGIACAALPVRVPGMLAVTYDQDNCLVAARAPSWVFSCPLADSFSHPPFCSACSGPRRCSSA